MNDSGWEILFMPIKNGITCSHLPFMNGLQWDFLKPSYPVNLSLYPVPSHPVSFICSQMAISLMLETVHNLGKG